MSHFQDKSDSERMMEIFDALPQCVRRAMADADFPWHPRVTARLVTRVAKAEDVAAMIRRRTEKAGQRR